MTDCIKADYLIIIFIYPLFAIVNSHTGCASQWLVQTSGDGKESLFPKHGDWDDKNMEVKEHGWK